MPGLDQLRTSVSAFLSSAAPPAQAGLAAPARFSAFNPTQVAAASQLAEQLATAARTAGGGDAGITAALKLATQSAQIDSPGVAKYALLIFLTHDPTGARLGVPPLEERHPAAIRAMVAAAAAAPPASLAYFREDVTANEHHEHWHVVYRTNSQAELDRQGELFIYMHQQMLARYDTERLALGLPLVEALDVSKPITEGYDPYAGEAYGPRAPNQKLAAATARPFIATGQAYDHAITQKRFEQALAAPYPPKITASGANAPLDLLGATIEQHADPLAGIDHTNYGMHNSGHVAIADLSQGAPGVMTSTATAIRDPVFWQWHRHIDDYAHAWQEQQPTRDYTADPFQAPPPVRIRKSLNGNQGESPDIILCTRQAMKPADFNDTHAGQAWATATFGGAHWDTDLRDTPPATHELLTTMTDRTVKFADGSSVDVHHLDQVDEFAWVIRLENLAQQSTDVTLRIFLAAEDLAENRRMWIEMDKLVATLDAGAKSVIYQPSSLSSVIRKPAQKPTGPLPQNDHADTKDYCQCGWPYNLLLPRGTKAGMPFRVLVMLTDATKDRIEANHACGSMSFCGARDRYPDRRNMGYPFDRPLRPSLTDALDALPHVARRSLTIRWT